MKFKMS